MPGRPRALAVLAAALAALLCSLAAPAIAQTVIEGTEDLAPDRPESWAMHHAAASTLFTGFGTTDRLATGEWRVAGELHQVPWLDARQRAVGFSGDKAEDLNKLPVFARLRADVGLPAGFVAELGWTPPVRANGAQARGMFAVGLGRQLWRGERAQLSARAHMQRGAVGADITCPAELAGELDPAINPYGCEAPSRDVARLHLQGAELSLATDDGPWRWHATAGLVRTDLEVQVDALAYGFRERTLLRSEATRHYLALGTRRAFGARWSLAAELLHMPLPVRRNPSSAAGDDAFTGLRVQLRWAVGPGGGPVRPAD